MTVAITKLIRISSGKICGILESIRGNDVLIEQIILIILNNNLGWDNFAHRSISSWGHFIPCMLPRVAVTSWVSASLVTLLWILMIRSIYSKFVKSHHHTIWRIFFGHWNFLSNHINIQSLEKLAKFQYDTGFCNEILVSRRCHFANFPQKPFSLEIFKKILHKSSTC